MFINTDSVNNALSKYMNIIIRPNCEQVAPKLSCSGLLWFLSLSLIHNLDNKSVVLLEWVALANSWIQFNLLNSNILKHFTEKSPQFILLC